MSFLNPILLTGLAAIAVPIIIHFLNRRRFQKVAWAAMKFLQISVERNQRRMRMEDLILLVLRCLLLALLALALARPAWLTQGANVFGQTKVTGVLLLDNSYSMGMSDGAATRFEKAQQAAEAVLDSMPAGSAVALSLASDVVQDVIPEPTYDLNLVRQSVRQAALTDRASDLFPALDAALHTLDERLALRKEIFLVTDGQSAGWRQLVEIQKRLERSRNEIKCHLILVNEHESANLGVSGLRLAAGLAPARHPLRFEVRVANYGRAEARDVRLTLHLNDEPPADEFVIESIAPGASRGVALFARLPGPGYHTVTARLPEDRLPADDRRTVAVRAINQISVLLVDGAPGDEPRDAETYFLRHALAPVPTDQVQNYFIRTTTLTGPELPGARLDDYDAVVLANVAGWNEAVTEAMAHYLTRGGGLMVFPGPQIEPAFYNERLHAGRGFLPASYGPPVGDAGQAEAAVHWQEEDYDHPIVDLWNDPAAGTLASARFFRHYPLVLTPESESTNAAASDASAVAQSGPVRIVVRYADGSPAVVERDFGLGRVIQFSSTADTAWCDLPVRPAFLPLVHRVLGGIVQRQDEGLNVRVGEPFRRRVSLDFLGKDANIVTPRQTEAVRDLRRIEMSQGWPILQYPDTDHAGAYQATLEEPELNVKFAAQPEASESGLEELSADQIGTLREVAQVIEWTPDLELRALVEQDRTGVEFWLPLLILVLALTGVETFLAQWFSRSK